MGKILSIICVLGTMSFMACGDDSQPAGTGGMAGGGASGAGGAGGTGGTGGTSGSGGASGTDGSAVDAPTDAAQGTDASAAACMAYCECMVNGNCQGSPNGFTSLDQCRTACANLTATQVDCRTQHCGLAQDSTSVHCQHAVGMGAGIPAACL